MTKSESNVKFFFENLGFSVGRIPEASRERPDYWLEQSNFRVAIEVKEITENDLEKEVRLKLEIDRHAGGYESRDDSKTLRNLIKKANSQLRELCTNGEAGILVVQDTRPFWTKSFWMEESLKQAMFGDLVIWRLVRDAITDSIPKTIGPKYGLNRSVTDLKNRAVSAVGILHHNSDPKKSIMNLYHNPFANQRLLLPVVSSEGVRQFYIGSVSDYGVFVEC